MLRGDDVICGASTTGTGTLTLASTPVPPGGADFDVWARALGFGNSAAFPVDYVITEYTDVSFATELRKEGGIGTLTLGSSSGIANCTLARTTIDYTMTGLNAQPATYNIKPGAGISIGTATNTLVMISPRALSVPGLSPYFENTLGDTNGGCAPDCFAGLTGSTSNWPTSNTDWYIPFRWSVPMLAKRVTVRTSTYTSVTGSPVLYARIYGINSSGRPGKLLYDFTPSSGVSITSSPSNFASGAAGNGILLNPSDYFMNFALTGLTGGTVNLRTPDSRVSNPAASRLGLTNLIVNAAATATGATAGAGPDPANTTSYAMVASSSFLVPIFGLSPT